MSSDANDPAAASTTPRTPHIDDAMSDEQSLAAAINEDVALSPHDPA